MLVPGQTVSTQGQLVARSGIDVGQFTGKVSAAAQGPNATQKAAITKTLHTRFISGTPPQIAQEEHGNSSDTAPRPYRFTPLHGAEPRDIALYGYSFLVDEIGRLIEVYHMKRPMSSQRAKKMKKKPGVSVSVVGGSQRTAPNCVQQHRHPTESRAGADV